MMYWESGRCMAYAVCGAVSLLGSLAQLRLAVWAAFPSQGS